MKRYKFLRDGLKSDYNNFIWEIGKWYKHEGDVWLCSSGFHYSKEVGEMRVLEEISICQKLLKEMGINY